MELRGKNALVTGATGGLGVAESEALARAGAAVLMLDVKGGRGGRRDQCRAAGRGAGKVRYVACDLADPQAAQALAQRSSTARRAASTS